MPNFPIFIAAFAVSSAGFAIVAAAVIAIQARIIRRQTRRHDQLRDESAQVFAAIYAQLGDIEQRMIRLGYPPGPLPADPLVPLARTIAQLEPR